MTTPETMDHDQTQRSSECLRLVLSSPQQLKVFKTSLQVLMKIGSSNLMIVGEPGRILLSACNSARSCYVSADLHQSFFTSYVYQCGLLQMKVTVPFKNVQAILRTSRIRVLTLSLVPEINVMIATLECDRGLVKEYRIAFSEDQAIFRPAGLGRQEASAVWFDTNDASSFSKVLSTLHVNSAADLVAIAYDARDGGIKLFTDCQGVQVRPDAAVQKDALHTSLEMNNSIGHFGTIRNMLGMSTKVSFNLRDFLVLVHTAEGLSCDLSLCFSVPGRPVSAICSPALECRIEMMLVTLNEPGSTPSNVVGGPAGLASQHSLGGLAGQLTNGQSTGENHHHQLSGHMNPFDLLGAHVNVDVDEYGSGAGEFGTLEDPDAIASTPPQSPNRPAAHIPGVIM